MAIDRTKWMLRPEADLLSLWQASRCPARIKIFRLKSNAVMFTEISFVNRLHGNGWLKCYVSRSMQLKGVLFVEDYSVLAQEYLAETGYELNPPGLYCGVCGQSERAGYLSENEGMCAGCLKDRKRRSALVDGNMRRVRELNAWGSHTEEEWLALVSQLGGICLRCGQTPVTKDHIVPLSRGGSNDIANLQPLCRSCNSWKGIRIIDLKSAILAYT